MRKLDRLATYVSWPADTSVSCLSLANSGFVYTGVSDQVVCLLCGLAIKDWQQINSNPLNEHRLRSPQCAFFTEPSPNVGAEQPSDRGPTLSSSYQRDSSMTDQSTSNIANVYRLALERAQRHGVIGGDVQPTGNTTTSRDPEAGAPRAVVDRANPDYGLLKHESTRLSTFDDWPASGVVQPSALAAAGLFYTGRADRTCCAFCRGVLHSWQPHDVPDVEHRRHFPDCTFVRQQNVGNVPLHGDASLDRQVAAVGISDVSRSTSADTRRSTSSSAGGDVAVNNRAELLNQGLAAASSERQRSADNSAKQRTAPDTTTTTNAPSNCAVFFPVKVLVCTSQTDGW